MQKHRRRSDLKRRRRTFSERQAAGAAADKPKSAGKTLIRVLAYDGQDLIDEQVDGIEQLKQYRRKLSVAWVDVEGTEDIELLEQIGALFDLHYLFLETIINTRRAKVERYGEQFFIVLQPLQREPDLVSKQVCLAMGSGYVVSFHEGKLDAIELVRNRIRTNFAKIRDTGSDYLAYAIVDAVVESYFPLLEEFGERLETLEDEIIDKPSRQAISDIHNVKRDLLTARRAMWPMRDAINVLLRDGSSLIGAESQLHLRDCYDHAVQIIDFIETDRELGADLMDVYLSSISNRMNEVMKVLTIITTIFVPPTLIAGIYGMNFRHEISPYNMPEYSWYYGYPYALILMLLVSLAVVAMLWWKGWLEVLSHKSTSISPAKRS